MQGKNYFFPTKSYCCSNKHRLYNAVLAMLDNALQICPTTVSDIVDNKATRKLIISESVALASKAIIAKANVIKREIIAKICNTYPTTFNAFTPLFL